MSYAVTSSIAEKVRAAVACFRAAQGGDKLYVLLEAPGIEQLDPKLQRRAGVTRLALRRLYAGEHKGLEGKWTVAIGQDLAEPQSGPIALPLERSFEVVVRATPFAGAELPFEGVFELRAIELEKR